MRVPARPSGEFVAADADGFISPSKAVQLAASAEGLPVAGTFRLKVQSTGRQDGNIYLNSERDYRDQRNLTIAISPQAILALQKQNGSEPDQYFQGKSILVSGSARRTKIIFTIDGKPTEKYYFQTHVVVTVPTQIEIQ